MSLTLNVNTWVTIVEANTYFSAKWTASTLWSSLTSNQKEILLINAYNWINQQEDFSFSGSLTEKLKQAQCETAWYIYRYGESHEKRQALGAQGVKDFKVIDFEETLGASTFPVYIQEMLSDYIIKGNVRIIKLNREL